MINLKTEQVGTFQGSSMGILKAIGTHLLLLVLLFHLSQLHVLLGALLLRPFQIRVVGPDDLAVSLVLPIVPVPVVLTDACAAPAGVCRGVSCLSSLGRVVAL